MNRWIDSKEFDSNKYSSNNSKGWAREVDLEYPEELRQLHNDYPLVPDEIEIKEKTLSRYQVMIADLYNISIVKGKKLVTDFFDKEKYELYYHNLQLYLRLGLHCLLGLSQSQWLKPYVEFNIKKE